MENGVRKSKHRIHSFIQFHTEKHLPVLGTMGTKVSVLSQCNLHRNPETMWVRGMHTVVRGHRKAPSS